MFNRTSHVLSFKKRTSLVRWSPSCFIIGLTFADSWSWPKSSLSIVQKAATLWWQNAHLFGFVIWKFILKACRIPSQEEASLRTCFFPYGFGILYSQIFLPFLWMNPFLNKCWWVSRSSAPPYLEPFVDLIYTSDGLNLNVVHKRLSHILFYSRLNKSELGNIPHELVFFLDYWFFKWPLYIFIEHGSLLLKTIFG